ncbi:MAG TPA: hypothetical protein VIT20_04825 [Propionibacteriaceae bacterium]
MNHLHPSGRLVLLAAGLGLTVWAWLTYPLVDHSWIPFVQVAFWAQLPAVIAALSEQARHRRTTRADALVAVLPSFVVVGVLVSLPWPRGRAATDPEVVIGLTIMVWGWLLLGLLGAAALGVLGWPAPRHRRSRTRLIAGLATFPTAVGLGLTMPVVTAGLLGSNHLELREQLHALTAGYGDPTASRMVGAYALLFVLLATTSLLGRSAEPSDLLIRKELHPCPNPPPQSTPTVESWPARPSSARPQPPSGAVP